MNNQLENSEELPTLMQFEKDNPEMVGEAVEKLMAEELAIEEMKKWNKEYENDYMRWAGGSIERLTCDQAYIFACRKRQAEKNKYVEALEETGVAKTIEIASLKQQLEAYKDNALAGCLPIFSDYEEQIEKLKRQVGSLEDRLKHEVAMIDGAAKDEIEKLMELVETLNQIRDNLQDENRKLISDMKIARECMRDVVNAGSYMTTQEWALLQMKIRQALAKMENVNE